MKVVLITHYNTPISERLHRGFLKNLSRYCDYKVVKTYDKKTGVKISAKEVYDLYKPDVMMAHAHSGALRGYFKNIPCLKVMIAVDFWKIKAKNKYWFYESNDFDLVFHRGYETNPEEIIKCPSVWLPFSANEEEFYPEWHKWNDRRNKVVFIGTSGPAIYSQRKKAIKKLESRNLLHNVGRIKSEDYPEKMRQFTVMLNSAELLSPYGKIFEAMASGTVVITPMFNGWSTITHNEKSYSSNPNDGNLVYYKKHCSNVIERAQILLNNKDYTKQLAKNSYDLFIKNHTDKLRSKELYNNLVNMIKGNELIRKWDINKEWGEVVE